MIFVGAVRVLDLLTLARPMPMELRARVLVLILMAGCRDRPAGPHGAATGDSTDQPSRPLSMEATAARYHGGDEVLAAGDASRGQVAVLRVMRAEIIPGDVTAYTCEGGPRKMFLKIRPGAADAVRALPKDRPATGECPRAVVRIRDVVVGFVGAAAADGGWAIRPDGEAIIEGDLLGVLDVAPRPPTAAPPGVDFATLDDLALGGGRDGGRIVELRMQRRAEPSLTSIFAEPCDGEGTDSVAFPDQTPEGRLGVLTGCHTVRFRSRPFDERQLVSRLVSADLISIDGR